MSERVRVIKRAIAWAVVIVCFIAGIFLLVFEINKRSLTQKTSTLPEIKLTLNGVTLDEINNGSKRIKYTGNEMILVDQNSEYRFNNVEIRGRGNASWAMDKKSYRIKLSEKVDLFRFGKIRKWAMISNNRDVSLMRNDLGYYVASLLYENYPIQGEFVKFAVDDKELGLYYMSELVTIDKNSVDLRDPLGILAEVDNVYCKEEEYRVARLSDCITIDDVVVEDNKDEALNLFMDDYNEFEKIIKRGDYDAAAEKADMESFARYYLLGEFSSNPDTYVTSWYLYKDGEEDKIHSNIGWDFDGAFGNENWWVRYDGLYSPTELMARAKYSVEGWDSYGNDVKRCELLNGTLISPTICYLVDMPEFRDLVRKIYREKLMGRRKEIIAYIREISDYIRDEAIIDNELWNKGDFDEDVGHLIWWIDKRFDYFDELYGWGWPAPAEL